MGQHFKIGVFNSEEPFDRKDEEEISLKYIDDDTIIVFADTFPFSRLHKLDDNREKKISILDMSASETCSSLFVTSYEFVYKISDSR